MSAAPASNLALVPKAALWISAEEVMQRTGWSERTFFRRQAELFSRETTSRSSNGRRVREFLESSLPLPQAEPTYMTSVSPAAILGPLFAGMPSGSLERSKLTDPDDQAQADARYQILEPLIHYHQDSNRYAALLLADGRPVTSHERLIEYIAATSDPRVSVRTIKRWLAAYREGGDIGLADRSRSDKGQSRWFEQHPEAKVFAAYLYLVEKQSIQFVVEQLEFETALLGLNAAELPSRETVRTFLNRSISPAMRTLARQGERQYRERMAPYLKRGYVDVFSNQVWVGDHAIIDREIQNDFFTEVPVGTPGRLRISAFVDYRSRKAWATWAWEGSSRSIAATLVRAMLEVGPPEQIYVDNGKDYKKVAKGAERGCEVSVLDDEKAPSGWFDTEYQTIERTGLLKRLGIAVTHCIPRHPQSKHVERFFRTMHLRLDTLGRTYTSGNPFTRPEAAEKAMMRHRRLLKAGQLSKSDHPTASQYILDALMWIEEYNNTPHDGEGMDGRTPNEVFEAYLNPEQKPVPEPTSLALLMADYTRRWVHECAVRLNNYRYTPRTDDRTAWAAMHEANEQEVLIGYNPEDPEFAVVLTLDGHLIAWLEAEKLVRFAPNDPVTQQEISDSMSIRRGLEKSAKQTLQLIESTAKSMGVKSPEESLRSRGRLSDGAGFVITQRKPRFEANNDAHPQNMLVPGQAADRLAERLRRNSSANPIES